MSEWKFVEYQSLASQEKSSFSMGPFGSKITKEHYAKYGIPLIRGNNLARGIFHDDDFVFITEEKANDILPANVSPGDIIFTHRGTIGQVTMLPRSPKYDRYAIGSSQVKTRLDESIALPEFYYYWFHSPEGQRSILANTSTVGVPGIATPLTSIRKLQVPRPSLKEQKEIAAALGALDDKIAVNERIASTALALADSLFASKVAGVKFGEDTFGSIARVGGGGTPKTKEDDYWGGDVAWATPKDITALESPYLFETGRTITPLGLENCASALYPAQSIFMTSRATIGAFAIPQIPTAVNQGFIVVLPPTEDLRWWLFHEMRSRVDDMLSLANGSTFLELSRKNFKAMPVRIPEPETIQRFSSRVKPLHESARNAASESRILTELRDTLLPQLMSGKLRVKDAEKIVEDNV